MRLKKLRELVKKMSLKEVRESDNRIDGDENMLINNGYSSQQGLDLQNISAAIRMEAATLPDKLYQHGDTSMYEELGTDLKTKKMTKKGLEYQISLMKEKRQKMYSRLLRKCDVVEDLLSSSRNMIAIEEETSQLNMFKLLMSLHREYGDMLKEEEQMENDDWFDFVDEDVFPFKRKINLWLKKVEEDQISSERSKGSHSKRSSKKNVKSNMTKTLGSSSRSRGSKTRELEEKAEEAFLFRRQIVDNEAEKLKIQQMVAKARARTKIFEESEIDNKFLYHDKQKFVKSCQDIHGISTGISCQQRSEIPKLP